MEMETIMVLTLSVGVLALLVWFEVNSRRNERKRQNESSPVLSVQKPLPEETHNRAELETGEKKTA